MSSPLILSQSSIRAYLAVFVVTILIGCGNKQLAIVGVLASKMMGPPRTCVRTFSPSTMSVSSHLLESRLFYTQTKTGTDDKNAAFVTQ